MTGLVHVACLEISHQLAVTRSAHFISGVLEIVRIKECRADAARHFLGAVAENSGAARAHFDESAAPIRDQDEIERRVEQTTMPLCQARAFLLLAPKQANELCIEGAHVE